MAQEEKNAKNQNNLLRYAMNPKAFTLRKWLSELLKEQYTPHDDVIERIATSLATDKDLEDFGKFIMKIYECAYLRAVKDYKEQAEKLGLKVVIN
jgi:energy-converting hydrogenase A subunit M